LGLLGIYYVYKLEFMNYLIKIQILNLNLLMVIITLGKA
jgi:hypothetical protein